VARPLASPGEGCKVRVRVRVRQGGQRVKGKGWVKVRGKVKGQGVLCDRKGPTVPQGTQGQGTQGTK